MNRNKRGKKIIYEKYLLEKTCFILNKYLFLGRCQQIIMKMFTSNNNPSTSIR